MASTKCKYNNGLQMFYNNPMFVAAGTISENEEFDSVTEAAIFSTTIPAGTFNSTNMHFRLTLGGHISSDGSDDLTLSLNFGSTAVLATLVTSTYPNEDDKAFICEYVGRIHTAGASGKVVAQGRLMMEATGMADIKKSTAVAGVSVVLTTVTSINVSADWDGTATDTDIIVTYGVLELYTQ